MGVIQNWLESNKPGRFHDLIYPFNSPCLALCTRKMRFLEKNQYFIDSGEIQSKQELFPVFLAINSILALTKYRQKDVFPPPAVHLNLS